MQPLGHFAWHWARHCTDTCAFLLLNSQQIFLSWISSVAISRWQGFNSLHEHLTSNLLEHLDSWTRARGPNSATYAGLEHGPDYSDCRSSEEMSKSAWPMNCWKYLKTRAYCEGFQPSRPRLACTVRASSKHENLRSVILLFWQGSHTMFLWAHSAQVESLVNCDISTSLTNCHFLCSIWWHNLKHGRQLSIPCLYYSSCLQLGSSSACAVTIMALADTSKKIRLLIILEHFSLKKVFKFVLTHFKGL